MWTNFITNWFKIYSFPIFSDQNKLQPKMNGTLLNVISEYLDLDIASKHLPDCFSEIRHFFSLHDVIFSLFITIL